MNRRIDSPYLKSFLVFLGLLCKALSSSPPLPVPHGIEIQAIASKLWIAVDGLFVYTLNPPKFKRDRGGSEKAEVSDGG